MTLWDVLKSDTMQHAYRVEEYRVRRMIKLGKLGPSDCIRKSGEESWIRVADIDPSMWTDELPTKSQQRDQHEKRKREKPTARPKATRKARGPTLPAKEIQESPVVPAVPSLPTPDAAQETVHVEMHLDQPVPAALRDQSFEIGPVVPADESPPGRRPRLTPPPLRKHRLADEEDVPLTLRRVRTIEGLDLTSMVDVVFLLMLFFMVAAAYSQQKAMEIPPPPADEAGARQATTLDDLRDDNLLIEVLEDNRVLLNDREVPVIELAELLRREMRETGMNEVVVRAAPDAYHETVIAVFDAANAASVQRIRLANPTRGVTDDG